MLRRTLLTIMTTAGIVLAATGLVSAQTDATATPEIMEGTEMIESSVQTGYAPVNGLELYYEIHGAGGVPLVLLHGGLGSTDMFAALLPTFSETRQVIAVDLQGHGRTGDIDRPLTYEAMADDIASLLDYLEIDSADIMGYSLGGGVALQTAVRHPELVHKLVLISAPFRRDGWYPEVLEGMSAMTVEAAPFMLETPMYQLYSGVAPNVEDWSTLIGKLGDLLSQDYDWTEAVDALEIPALIVIGDADSIRPSHAVEMFGLFGGGLADGGSMGVSNSQFAVLPNTLHWSILMRADLLLPIVTPFLDAPVAEAG